MKKKTWIIAGAVAVVVLGGAGVAVAATDPFDNDDRLSGQELESASAAALEAVGEGTVSEAERSNDLDHDYTVEVRLDNGDDVDVELDDSFEVVRVDGVVPGTGTNRGSGSGADDSDDAAATTAPATPATRVDDDTPITAEERASAESAALAEVGSGSVTDLDRSDESDHAWEVEVTVADGTDFDVELADDFSVVSVDGDN
jgi:uncharacterized membrane protein YkoI